MINGITTGFGINKEYLDDMNRLASLKYVADRKAIKEISEFIINKWTCDKITIEEGEWIQGIPSEDSPNVIPFVKTFYINRE